MKAAILAENLTRAPIRFNKPMYSRFPLLILSLLACTLAPDARAFGPLDPFDTQSITPPRPLLYPSADGRFVPCKALPDGARYGVLEVVDLALCQNPRTREAWANARAQAAQVGVAQSDYLPSLDGKASVGRYRIDADNANQRSASLTLS